MELSTLLAFAESNGWALTFGIVLLYIVIRSDISFRYPSVRRPTKK